MSKVWFVTGASRGFGRRFAEAALSRGDKVAATARNAAALTDLVTVHGATVLPLELDVTDKTGVFASGRLEMPDPTSVRAFVAAWRGVAVGHQPPRALRPRHRAARRARGGCRYGLRAQRPRPARHPVPRRDHGHRTVPTATFALTGPVDLGSTPEVTARATGDLTIHGRTNSVTFELAAQRTADGFRVNGSIPVRFADYGVDAPNFGGIAVEDAGTIEFLLAFSPA